MSIRNLLIDSLWLTICEYTDKGVLVWYFVVTNQDLNETILLKLMNNCFVNHLKQECFGDDFDIFREKLKQSGGIIAGSYPASVFAGSICENSDVDIFVPEPRIGKITSSSIVKIEIHSMSWTIFNLLEWFYSSRTSSTHMTSDRGYDWNEISYVHSIADFQISGEAQLLDRIYKRKLRMTREINCICETFKT